MLDNLIESSFHHRQNITSLWISCHHDGGDMIIMYADDGGGSLEYEKDQVFKNWVSKKIQNRFFLMREILFITGITIRETGEPGKGVRLKCRYHREDSDILVIKHDRAYSRPIC